MSEKIYRRVGERVVCKTLPNGLPVYVVVKPGFARKYAFFATRYGGMDPVSYTHLTLPTNSIV